MLKSVLLIATFLLSTVAHANWVLDAKSSQLNFISIKKGSIGEVHSFTELSGAISDKGTAELNISLASVSTGIAIRDQRMQEHLFEVKKFPSAKVDITFDKGVLKGLAVGESVTLSAKAMITLHGATKEQNVDVLVTKNSTNKITAATATPVMINASDYALVAGIDVLKGLANLPSIAVVVPVTAVLTFVSQ